MYRALFDPINQNNMTSYFINELAPKGVVKVFQKHTLIDPMDAECVYIVLSGECRQGLVSSDGNERTFYRLNAGTIFGEMDFFEGYRTCEIVYVNQRSEISVLPRDVLKEELKKNPEIYERFIHSITRKYRLLMIQLAESRFNDSIGLIASTLLCIGSMQEGCDIENRTVIKRAYTHEELANTLGLSRPTITNGLSYLREKKLISTEGKKIVIENVSELKTFTNTYW